MYKIRIIPMIEETSAYFAWREGNDEYQTFPGAYAGALSPESARSWRKLTDLQYAWGATCDELTPFEYSNIKAAHEAAR